MGAYDHFRAGRRVDNLKDFGNPFPDAFADGGDLVRYILKSEKLLWINLPIPDVLVVDVSEDALPYLEPAILTAQSL